MGRAVLAETDRIVGQHEDHALAHQRREADRRPAVVGEDQERAAVGDHAAVQGHAVHGRGHGVLAHSEMDVAAARRLRGHRLQRGGLGVDRAGQVGRAADQLRHRRRERLEHLLAGLARRPGRPLLGETLLERAQHAVQAGRQVARLGALELGPGVRRLARQTLLPGRAHRRAAAAEAAASRRAIAAGSRTADRASRARAAPPPPRRRQAASHGSRRCRPCAARRSRSWCGTRSGSAGPRPGPPPEPLRSPRDRGRRSRSPRQPYASNRMSASSDRASDVDPSIEMWLSS